MSKRGPIIVFEEDALETSVLKEAFSDLRLPNAIYTFDKEEKVVKYLYETKENPFLIISDIGDHLINGLELRRKINEDDFLRRKSIPFIFLTDVKSPKAVAEAYEMSVQGYFIKQNTIADLKKHLKRIVDYWASCLHPNVEEN
ncbi:MAG: response regulator [Flaviaesturariibacter sp.]|nr:response regulator [Flaviaesturariibacter sp.]